MAETKNGPGQARAIDLARAALEKQFGKGVIFKMDERVDQEVPHVQTGLISLDRALGIGGWPRGRVVELYGLESSGKTTLALEAVAEAQRQGGICAYVDAEHALDPTYATALGCDMGKLLVSQPDCGEQALEVTETMVRTSAVSVVIVDSVAALTPKAELEGDMGDSHVALQARLMSQALRKLVAVTHNTGTLVFFINQLREKIGVMFGNKWTTPGGNALKFYSSVRCEVKRIGTIKRDDRPVASKTLIKVVKNKLAPPFKEALVEMTFGKGTDKVAELLDLGALYGLVEKEGAFTVVQGERLAQGREKAKEALRENAKLQVSLRAALEQAIADVGWREPVSAKGEE